MQGPTGTRTAQWHNKTLTYVASNEPNKTFTIPVTPQQIPHPAPSSPARAGLHPIQRTDLGSQIEHSRHYAASAITQACSTMNLHTQVRTQTS